MLARSLLNLNKALSPPKRTWTSLTRAPESLIVHALATTFPYVWLRDSCQSPQSVNPATGHKLHRTSDIPLSIAPIEGENGIQITDNGLEIFWKDGQRSLFEKHWLQRYASPTAQEKYHWNDTLKPQLWTRASIPPLSTLSFPYHEIQSSDERMAQALELLFRYGIVFVRGVPKEETSDDKCELQRLAKLFGDMRRTFYGVVWDVVKLKDGNNVGYTDLPLGHHMDLLFYENPPQYQILHCLRHKAIGGSNFVVDGLYAAQRLRETHPTDFDILTKTPVPFQYIHDNRHAIQHHFTITLPPSSTAFSSPPEITSVNYSPHEQGPLPLSTPKAFYPALKRFSDLLEDEAHTVRFNLEEGDAAMWDNRRIVHGRTGFRSMTDEEWQKSGLKKTKAGEPDRWLKGCYLGADAVLDRVRTLKTKLASGN